MSRNKRGAWTFVLANAQGVALSELTTATGKSIQYTRNSYAEASFTLSQEDDDAFRLWSSLRTTGMPTLRCYRRGPFDTTSTLRFNGQLAPFDESADEAATLNAVFRSPFARLLGDGTDRGRYTDANYTITPNGLTKDAGVVASDLLNVANTAGDTGLALGTVETTVQRERLYNYSNIGEAIQELTSGNVLDGFDFEEVFVEAGTTLAQLNIHAQLGQDRPTVKFEYGPGTMANVSSMTRSVQAPINHVTLLGGNGLVSVKSDANSIAKYGLYPSVQDASDVTQQSILDARAQALLRPNIIASLTFTPDYGLENCPQPFDDFSVLGDLVHVFANRKGFYVNSAARLHGAQIVIDDNGFEAAEIADPSTPGEDAALRASLAVEVEDTGEDTSA